MDDLTRGAAAKADGDDRDALARERDELLERIAAGLERPMALLALVWLVLMIVELVRGLPPVLGTVNTVIWGCFVVQAVLEFIIAPSKGAYLRQHWLTVVALALPALRLVRALRVLRVVRVARGARLLRLIGGANRGMRTLGRVMGRRGLGYVVALTALVQLLGAAGMYALERDVPDSGVATIGAALWWTAMTLTTMGADWFPRTGEGRLLTLLLATYGFAVFGYVTASIASFFVAQESTTGPAPPPSGDAEYVTDLAALRDEVVALRALVQRLADDRDLRRRMP